MDGVIWDDRRPASIDYGGPVSRPFDPIDAAWRARSILERFDHICDRFPDRIAVDDGRSTLTYADLRARAYGLADQLLREAPTADPICALISDSAIYPIALVATLALGRTLTPIDVTHPFARKKAILDEAVPALVLLEAEVTPEPELILEGTAILRIDLASLPESAERPPSPAKDRLTGIAFTSGSTGRPKGLAYDQAATLAFIAEYVNSLHVNEDDVILALASLGAGGNLSVLGALLTGAKVRMIDIKSAGMGGVLRTIRDDGVTLLSMVPVVFRAMFQQPQASEFLGSMRAINTGGDRLVGADLALFRAALPETCLIRQTQGSTETAVVFHWFIPRDMAFADQATVPSGYLAEGAAVGLLDQTTGEDDVIEGEILVRGAHFAAGGWQSGRLTPGPFVADPGDPERKIYGTGDVVRRHPSGVYEFVGRRDRQIKILGLRADPADVEAILRTAPGVGDVAVIPRRSEGEAAFVAFVSPLDLHNPPTATDLQAAVAAAAPPHMVPAEVRFLPAIPRLPNFKPDFVMLEALDRAHRPVKAAEPAPSPASTDQAAAEAVRRAWTATLGEASLAEDRPWNRAGGDSLKALQFMLRVEEALGSKLPLELFDETLAPSGFVQKIAAYRAGGGALAAKGPLVFLCPGIKGDEPRLANFRRALNGWFRFEVIDYPDLERNVAELTQAETLFAAALDQIERAAPQGPIRLAGYSLGGLVAFELAVRLAAKGRTVERVCVIDTDARLRDVENWKPEPHSPLRHIEWARTNVRKFSLGAAMQEFFIGELLRLRAFGLLRGLILWKSRKGRNGSIFARNLLLERLRGQAFLGWRPTAYSGELWVLRATERRKPDEPRDLHWSGLARSVRVLDAPGDHYTMMLNHLPELCAAFAQAMSAAQPAEELAANRRASA